MTNSTKQAIKTVSNASSISALGHKTLSISEVEASPGSTEYVPKLLEKIIESKPNNKLEKNSSKRNTPMTKMPVIAIEENILEEEDETVNPYETDDSYQNTSQLRTEYDTTTLNSTNLNQSNLNVSDITPKEEKKIVHKHVKKHSKKGKQTDKKFEDVTETLTKSLEQQDDRESEKKVLASPEEKTKKFKRKTHQRNASLDSENQRDANFDLYKTQNASLLYIKQKYKMYLDWLAEHSSIENLLNQGNEKGSRKRNPNYTQLNWYQYERTHINSNNRNYFKYLENSKNSNNLMSGGPKPVSHSSFGHVSKNVNEKNASYRPITNLSTLNSDYMPLLVNSHEDTYSLSNKSKGVKFDKTHLNSLNPKTSGNFDIRHNKPSTPTTNHSNEIFYPAISSFLSQLNNSHSSNNSTPLAMFSLQNHPKKPILKSSQSSDYSNSVLNQRRGSVLSNDSDQSSGKSSIQSLSNNNTANAKNNSNKSKNSNKKDNFKSQINTGESVSLFNDRIGAVKLPPIARCSEDFYAVLHAMEKDRLV